MSWQGKWAGNSVGRWYGYGAPVTPVDPPAPPIYAYSAVVQPPAPYVAWLEARIGGRGDLSGNIGGATAPQRAVRARRLRDEELIRYLH